MLRTIAFVLLIPFSLFADSVSGVWQREDSSSLWTLTLWPTGEFKSTMKILSPIFDEDEWYLEGLPEPDFSKAPPPLKEELGEGSENENP